ncbi:MAG: PIN domain-containing protein [Chloroflexi bacterium]|nr:PIN domain-containing protein [Chloroflexota bacterium]
MSGYLLDTNVVSERTKEDPAQTVMDFLNNHDELWLSAIVVKELELGVQLMPQGRRRERLREWLNLLLDDYEGRISPIGRREAERAAVLQAQVRRSGGELELGDALIAGTAIVNDMIIVTRNVRDFDGLGIEIVNPWETT